MSIKKDYIFDRNTLNKIVRNGKGSYVITNFLGKNITFDLGHNLAEKLR